MAQRQRRRRGDRARSTRPTRLRSRRAGARARTGTPDARRPPPPRKLARRPPRRAGSFPRPPAGCRSTRRRSWRPRLRARGPDSGKDRRQSSRASASSSGPSATRRISPSCPPCDGSRLPTGSFGSAGMPPGERARAISMSARLPMTSSSCARTTSSAWPCPPVGTSGARGPGPPRCLPAEAGGRPRPHREWAPRSGRAPKRRVGRRGARRRCRSRPAAPRKPRQRPSEARERGRSSSLRGYHRAPASAKRCPPMAARPPSREEPDQLAHAVREQRAHLVLGDRGEVTPRGSRSTAVEHAARDGLALAAGPAQDDRQPPACDLVEEAREEAASCRCPAARAPPRATGPPRSPAVAPRLLERCGSAAPPREERVRVRLDRARARRRRHPEARPAPRGIGALLGGAAEERDAQGARDWPADRRRAARAAAPRGGACCRACAARCR